MLWGFGPWSSCAAASFTTAIGAAFVILGLIWLEVTVANPVLDDTRAGALAVAAAGGVLIVGGLVWYRRARSTLTPPAGLP